MNIDFSKESTCIGLWAQLFMHANHGVVLFLRPGFPHLSVHAHGALHCTYVLLQFLKDRCSLDDGHAIAMDA